MSDKQYPTHIEVPDNYWISTTTIIEYEPNKYWHKHEED
jgi:hypothetical protein